ncbi:cell shape determination protein CcmA [Clostridium thermarum]|uniref:cell shape determination protein CcmA n=1 Tax=Clostridium thermarum TaxID=1716543 RepID=UPI0013D249FC|nr:cell shape determination protein CcmA [Clostridium thermarum]
MANYNNKDKFEGKSDLKISGSSTSQGGIFNNVKISGSATINGDIECVDMSTSGYSKVVGNISSGEISTSGMCKVSGNVEATLVKTSGTNHVGGNIKVEELRTSGTSKIGGDVQAGIIDISGSVSIGGNVHAENIVVSGLITIGGDCESERFETSGDFRIGGLLNAGTIKVRISGKSNVREIGGEKIEVQRLKHRGFMGIERIIKNLFNIEAKLNCESIEGDEIFLEDTSARIVRGNNITIGRGCEIDTVEYTGTLNTIEDAIVKNVRML